MTGCRACDEEVPEDAIRWTPAGAICSRCLIAVAGHGEVRRFGEREGSDGDDQSGLGAF